jgi:metal-responsive CopG/Arc/MetJ family transcriptional regulator
VKILKGDSASQLLIAFANAMFPSSEKRRISITVDAKLLDEIDQWVSESSADGDADRDSDADRSLVFEEALRLWHAQKMAAQLTQFYQHRNQADAEFEEDWVEATQDEAIAAWNQESP